MISIHEKIREFSRAFFVPHGLRQELETACRRLGEVFDLERVLVAVKSGSELEYHSWTKETLNGRYTSPFRISSGGITFRERIIGLPLMISDSSHGLSVPSLFERLKSSGICSMVLFPLVVEGEIEGWFEGHVCGSYRRWRHSDRNCFEQISIILSMMLARSRESAATLGEKDVVTPPAEIKLRYQRLLEYGNSVIIRTDPEFRITEVVGDCVGLLGYEASDLISQKGYVWKNIVYEKDFLRLNRKISRMRATPMNINEEFRVVNRKTGRVRWLVTKGVPLFSSSNKLIGWEGVGLDVTERREAQEVVLSQSKRIEALYEVSRALRYNLDPSIVALKGLRALIRATRSNSGLCFFFDSAGNNLELVAAEGLSRKYIEDVERSINGPSLVRYSVESKEGVLIDDIQKDKRAVVKMARREGLKATIVAPLLFEDKALGAIVVFSKMSAWYTHKDFELVSAAASQISIATHQAELYAREKRQASSFAALYRLSHELSRHLTVKEVAQHAFSILHEELACKRMWLGVVNEPGTHIVGQGGFGPGIRKRIAEIQIELGLEHNFLDEVVARKEAVVVYPQDHPECSGLNTIMKKLRPGPFAIVPLVSVGQLVGILVIEPSLASGFFTPAKMSYLNSMASEIATVILEKRFEKKVAEAGKMRMAGLFASGIAHNFNNLLQAVMGQASLLEMQLPAGSENLKSVKIINDAAARGASLVNQLLAFAQQDSGDLETISVNEALEGSKDLYTSILGSNITLEFNLRDSAPPVVANSSQLQQIITGLLLNAKEACNEGKGRVKISTAKVRLRSGEIDPELAPGEYLRLSIEDNGCGMNEEAASRCFEPFYTTKNVDSVTGIGVGGSGLGLSYAYSTVKNCGGLITVDSKPALGSTFNIYLPGEISKTAATGTSLEHVNSDMSSTEAVCVALDGHDLVTTQSTLRSFGINCVNCTGSDELMALMKDRQNARLVIIDGETFGERTGEVVSTVNRFSSNTEIVVATKDAKALAPLSREIERIVTVEKPVEVQELHRICSRIVFEKADRSSLKNKGKISN